MVRIIPAPRVNVPLIVDLELSRRTSYGYIVMSATHITALHREATVKRTAMYLILAILLTIGAYAGDILLTVDIPTTDFSFVLADTENHPEILLDAIPTWAELGLKYSGMQLFDGKKTELFLLGGGAYGHVDLWTGLDGMPLVVTPAEAESDELTDQRTYNSWLADWRLRFQQFVTPVAAIPMGEVALFLEYAGWWTNPLENGDASLGLDGTTAAYPDQNGLLVNGIGIGALWFDLEKGASPVGFESEIALHALPEALGNNVTGRTDYYLFSTTAIGYYPLYTSEQESGLNLFSIYLAERFVADLVWGDAVPQRVQEPISLGRKMRGFEYNSYGTAYTVVNNFEVRLAGPEIFLSNVYPRFHVFLDAGLYGGVYLNTSYEQSGFLASTGFEAALNVFDLFAVGYRGTVILAGENMAGSRYVGGLMFGIQF
jgi:hypothetical protein